MNKDSSFFRQAELMLRVMPIVNKEVCFALKGGTAINFFVRDMPRLSVDIDLTYLPLEDRETSLAGISNALNRIAAGIRKAMRGIEVREIKSGGRLAKLLVSPGANSVKIEPNEVIRGALYKTEERDASRGVKKAFETDLTVRCLSLADLYGGKICAMLDRQHPRDMFDVKLLLENEGITEEVRRAFVVYLAGHNRPMEELLAPNLKDVKAVYESEFVGMTTNEVAYDELVDARGRCIKELRTSLDEKDKVFLMSLLEQNPKWDILGIAHLADFPSLQWKLRNVANMQPKKREASRQKLQKVLSG